MRLTASILLLAATGCGGAREPVRAPAVADVYARSGLEFRAETLVMESFPVQLETAVTITNTLDGPTEVFFPDGCIVLIAARPQAADTFAWDQTRTVGCTHAIVHIQLAPGETRRFASRTDAREILGDSLPDARYRIFALVRPDSERVLLDAGLVDLAVARN